jgi:hypothetical protein
MNGKSKALVALVVVVLLGALPSGAAAKEQVEKATTMSSFEVKGSNGYWVEVAAKRIAGERAAKVTVTAERQRYKVESVSVGYSVHSPLTADGGFDAKLPGLGRIDVSFDQEKTHKQKYPANRVCGRSTETLRKGTFRGTISFRAEGGFTVAHRSAAPGYVKEDSSRVCKELESSGWFLEGSGEPKNAYLGVAGPAGSPAVTFYTSGYPETEPPTSSGGIPTVAFAATWSTEKSGIQILARADRDTVSSYYRVPGPVGALTDATVVPPAPFKGTGAYHAESSTTASWTGDLSIEFPGTIGDVPLTGPGFTARLCEGATTCTGVPAPTS